MSPRCSKAESTFPSARTAAPQTIRTICSKELKLAALLAKGTSLDPTVVPAYSALKLATVNGAYAQGRENEIGRLIPGFDADIIMVNTHSPVCVLFMIHVELSSIPPAVLTFAPQPFRENLHENGRWFTVDVSKAIEDGNVSVFLRFSASEKQLNKQQGSMPASH